MGTARDLQTYELLQAAGELQHVQDTREHERPKWAHHTPLQVPAAHQRVSHDSRASRPGFART